MSFAEYRTALDRMFYQMPEVSTMPNPQPVFAGEHTDADIAALDKLLARHRGQKELADAEKNVRFWRGKAEDAKEFGRTDLVIQFLGLAETWEGIAESIRMDMEESAP